MSSNEIRQVEQSLSQAKQIVAMGESLQRLYSNRDFKKVILDGLFKDEPVRLVLLKAEACMDSPVNQEKIIKQMDAIGSLYQYFQTINQLASMASNSITADEQTLTELLEEDANV